MPITYTQYINRILTCLPLIFCLVSLAKADIEKVPGDLAPAFEHMISLTSQSNPKAPDPDHVGRLISFLNRSKDPKSTYIMAEREGATSNYSEFRLNRPFTEVLDLVYNPDIPAYLTSPASVRRSEWIQVNGKRQNLPMLSELFGKSTGPIVFTGVEYMENTPDTFSGAYYAYELDRALVLTRHQGRKVLISISHQRNKSEVGKKGLVLGDDENWNYLYTDESGCTKPGLGWVKSYMYDSASITVYYEESEPSPHVRCGVFKWIRAGWANINMVQPHHIRNGVMRFSETFKKLIESPALTDTAGFTKALRQIGDLPEEILRQKVKRHYLALRSNHQIKSRLILRWFDRFTGEDGYLAKMTFKEMKAVLEKAYLKKVLGKGTVADGGPETAQMNS